MGIQMAETDHNILSSQDCFIGIIKQTKQDLSHEINKFRWCENNVIMNCS
jgi:hypothetical protein